MLETPGGIDDDINNITAISALILLLLLFVVLLPLEEILDLVEE